MFFNEHPYERIETAMRIPASGPAQWYDAFSNQVSALTAGVRICPPYHLSVGALLRPGANTLAIEVTNTLVKQQRDFLSRYAQQEPSGLLGPVRLLYWT
jgi:hypothetical protein